VVVARGYKSIPDECPDGPPGQVNDEIEQEKQTYLMPEVAVHGFKTYGTSGSSMKLAASAP
jgi:hypothetical protein